MNGTETTKMRMPMVVSIEGNIGTGKSTTMAKLKKIFNDDARIAFIDEDVEQWVSRGMLNALYTGTLSAGTFQLCALTPQVLRLLEVLVSIKHDSRIELIISERSPWSNAFVFADLNLGTVERTAYDYVYENMMTLLSQYRLNVSFVYLDVSTKVAIDRMKARGRNAENNIPENYMAQLETQHKTFFTRLHAGSIPMHESHSVHSALFVPCSSEEHVAESIANHVRSIIDPTSPTSVM